MKILKCCFVLFCLPIIAFAQKDEMLYNLKEVPQSIYLNPAIQPSSRFNVSIPALGNVMLHAGKTDFKLRGIVNKQDTSFSIDSKAFVESLEDNNSMFFNTNIEVFHVGFASGQNYFHFRIRERFSVETNFPKEAAMLGYEVYSNNFLGLSNNIRNFGVNQSHLREFGMGWSRTINDKFTVGVTAKMYYGVSAIQTKSSKLDIQTTFDPQNPSDSVYVDMGFDINTSGVNDYTENNFENLLYKNNNWGFGFDLGASYKFNEKVEVSASALDVFGKVNFSNNVRNFRRTNIGASLTTIELANLFASEQFVNELGRISDTVRNELNNLQEETDAFSVNIPTRLMFAGTYNLNSKTRLTLLNHYVVGREKTDVHLRAIMNIRFLRVFTGMVSYGVLDPWEPIANLGLGFCLNLSVFQFYVLTNNALDPIANKSKNDPSIVFGANLRFGKEN
jgi:hypothetical protein